MLSHDESDVWIFINGQSDIYDPFPLSRRRYSLLWDHHSAQIGCFSKIINVVIQIGCFSNQCYDPESSSELYYGLSIIPTTIIV